MIVGVDRLARSKEKTYRVARKTAILRLAPTRATRPVQDCPSEVRKPKESDATESQIESARTKSFHEGVVIKVVLYE